MKSVSMKSVLIAMTLMLPCGAVADEKIFDSHVHLHDGDASIRKYFAQLEADKITGSGFGAMWFGGPNQALAGDPKERAPAMTRCWPCPRNTRACCPLPPCIPMTVAKRSRS